MACEKEDLLTLRDQLGSPQYCGWVHVAHLFDFLYCVVLSVFVLSLVPSACVSVVTTVDCYLGFLNVDLNFLHAQFEY